MQDQIENYKQVYNGNHIARRRPKKKKRKNILIFSSLFAVVLVITIGIAIFFMINKTSPILGTWVYDEYTQYVFEKNGNGCLEVDDVHYEYTYKVSDDKLSLDFSEEVVRDCEYTYIIEKNTLTLVGGKNTDGGTYKLTKK